MKNLTRRFIHFLAFGTFSLTGCFAAKYGMPADIDPYKGVKATTENGEAIKDLEVVLLSGKDTIQKTKTDSGGEAVFNYVCDYNTDYFVKINDIDGENNLGNFQSQTAELTEPDITTSLDFRY